MTLVIGIVHVAGAISAYRNQQTTGKAKSANQAFIGSKKGN